MVQARIPSRSSNNRGGSLSQAQRTQSGPSRLSVSESRHSQAETHDISDASICSSSYKKRTRGKTRGLGLAKKRRNGEKLDVDVPEALMRLVGNNAQDIITEIGCLARRAPIKVDKWRNVPDEAKKKMWASLKDKFQLPNDVEKVIDDQLSKSYRQHRYNMHIHYKNFSTLQEARQNPYEDISQDDWNFLVDFFNSEKFKKVSEINKENRSKLKINHISGTKSFARRRYDKRDHETGELLNRHSLWKETHYSESKGWVDERSREVIEEVEKLGSEIQEDGSVLDEDERFLRVLGEKSGYIRGLGPGPKPKNMLKLKFNRAEIEKELDSKIQSIRMEMQAEMEAQVEAQVEARVEARMAQMESDFQTQLQSMRSTFEQQMRQMCFPPP